MIAKISLKNPIILAIILTLVYLVTISSKGILGILSGPIIIVTGTIFLIILNFGLPDSFKSLLINHIKFILTVSSLYFLSRFLIEKDFISALQAFIAIFIYFFISSLIINSLKIMKKGHWITIILLGILTIGFMLFAFLQKISLDYSTKSYLEAKESITILEKQIEIKDAKLDSLNKEIILLNANK